MKTTLMAFTAVLAIATGGAANAAVVVNSMFGAPDPGPRVGETAIIDFDPLGALDAGVSIVGDFSVTNNSVGGLRASPAGDNTFYLSVPDSASSGSATMSFNGFLGGRAVSKFSFYWGSIDTYNKLELLDKSGVSYFTVNGGAIPPANGNQGAAATNRRVTFDLTGADQNLGGLKFTSTNFAFESDTFSFAVVPEP